MFLADLSIKILCYYITEVAISPRKKIYKDKSAEAKKFPMQFKCFSCFQRQSSIVYLNGVAILNNFFCLFLNMITQILRFSKIDLQRYNYKTLPHNVKYEKLENI